jgi:hypothetical protein
MTRIITSQAANVNTSVNLRIPRLTKLHRKILYFYYKLRLEGFSESDYSLEYLAMRLGNHLTYISTGLSELEKLGLMSGQNGGNGNKMRWITCAGFHVMDSLHQNQIQNQTEPIPYIDLSDQGIDKTLTESRAICGKLSIEEKLNVHLDTPDISSKDKKDIKRAIKSTPIGPVRRESLIGRVIKAFSKTFIRDKKNYILAALKNELAEVKEFYNYLVKNNIKFSENRYDMNNLNELGCFA